VSPLTEVIPANVKVCSTNKGDKKGEEKCCLLFGTIILTLLVILIVWLVLTRHLSTVSIRRQLKTFIADTTTF